MWPRSSGLIQTFFHAGGMTSALIRSIASRSLSGRPSVSRYRKPLPARRRPYPGLVRSLRRNRMAFRLFHLGEHLVDADREECRMRARPGIIARLGAGAVPDRAVVRAVRR